MRLAPNHLSGELYKRAARLCEPLAWRKGCCYSVAKAKLLTDSGGANLRHAFGEKKIQHQCVTQARE